MYHTSALFVFAASALLFIGAGCAQTPPIQPSPLPKTLPAADVKTSIETATLPDAPTEAAAISELPIALQNLGTTADKKNIQYSVTVHTPRPVTFATIELKCYSAPGIVLTPDTYISWTNDVDGESQPIAQGKTYSSMTPFPSEAKYCDFKTIRVAFRDGSPDWVSTQSAPDWNQ